MIGSYLKIVFRGFLRNKASTLINLIGLSIAFALFILLILFANNELTTDCYHKKGDRIYRLIERNDQSNESGVKFGPYLSDNYAEFIEVCRTLTAEGEFSVGENIIPMNLILMTDSNYFKIFTQELIWGDLDNSLNGNNGLVLTETASKKLFGNENPIGKFVKWDDQINLVVNAVIKDLPYNSSLRAEAFTSLSCIEIRIPGIFQEDGYWSYTTWVLLKENIDRVNLISKMSPDLLEKFGENTNFGLQGLRDIYFNKTVLDAYYKHGNIQLVNLFIGLAIFIIVLAGINYINLTTAHANIRSKEVCIRKVVGADKKLLVTQFLIESGIFVFVSLIFGFLLAEFFIPKFNLLADINLKVKTFYTVKYLLGFITGAIMLGIISGIYPAFVLSLYKPLDVIKGKVSKSKGSLIVRRVLFIFQFIISMIMIVGTIMIYRQVEYVKHVDLGFNKEKIIYLNAGENLVNNSHAFKDELMAVSGVEMISVCNGVSGNITNGMGTTIEGKEIRMKHLGCDENYLKLMGIEIKSGHGFTGDTTDINKSYLLNEAALKYLGWDDPYQMKIWRRKCIGIVKDFNFASLHQPIGPLFITYNSQLWNICIKFSGSDVSGILQNIETIWKNHYPEKPFSFRFVNNIIDKQYHAEEQLGKIIGYFALFALLIASLGLFGLTYFMVQQRTKEIGIRKVHGCSTIQIIRMFSFDFLKWLVIAFVISIPLSWYLVDYWLQNFAYRVSIDWWVFALSGIISVLISSFTIITLVYKASTMNPVDTLRYE